MTITQQKSNFTDSVEVDVSHNPVYVGVEVAILEQRLPPGVADDCTGRASGALAFASGDFAPKPRRERCESVAARGARGL
ncbi:MAG: hypothetical protein NWR52_03720 [Paracoccaceae bacterium]|nr:hypothetical protein [Paracoccaceae bacterium]